MYTLILTWMMITGSYSSGAVSMTTVVGFKTEAACHIAGNAWIQDKAVSKAYYAQALCVKVE